MKKKDVMSFALSVEELLVLLYHFKRSSLAGLDTNLLSDLSNKEKNLLMAVSERALIARSFLIRGANNKIKMIDPVLALVGTCLEPDKSIVLKFTRASGLEETIFFHAARKMRVIHTIPITGIHLFTAVEDDKAFLKALLSAAELGDTQRLDCESGSMDLSILDSGRDTALEKGIETATKLFIKKRFPENTAKELAKSLAKPISNTTISYINSVKNIVEGFTFLKGESALWLITPNEEDEKVFINSISSDDAIQKIKSLIINSSN